MSGNDFGKLIDELSSLSWQEVITNVSHSLEAVQNHISQISAEQIYKDCITLSQDLHIPEIAEAIEMKARIMNLSLIFAIADSQFVKQRIFKLQPTNDNKDLPPTWIKSDLSVNGTQVPCRYIRAKNERMIAPFLGGFYSQIAEYQDVIEDIFLANGISCLVAQHPKCDDNWLDTYQKIPQKLLERAIEIKHQNNTKDLPIMWASHSAGCAMFEIDRRNNQALQEMIQNELAGIVHFHPYFGPAGATKQHNPVNRWLFKKHAENNITRRYGHSWGDLVFQFANLQSIRNSESLDKITPLFSETLDLTRHIETHLDQIKEMPNYKIHALDHYYFIKAEDDHLVCHKAGEEVATYAGAEILKVEAGHSPTPEQLLPIIDTLSEIADGPKNIAPIKPKAVRSYIKPLSYQPA